ncbi:MAG: tetratricopeptide repeat protein [Verrucomicrobiales bacterium]|nr:tetratricopeptide repeat protein [Verrucomicrobiales bacterium]
MLPTCSPPSLSSLVTMEMEDDPGPQPAAKNSDEWMERLHLYDNAWRVDLDNLYAELPSPEDWQAVRKGLESDVQKSKSSWLQEGARERRAESLKCFAAVLQGESGREKALEMYRELLRPYLSKHDNGYPSARKAREHHRHLMVLGSSKKAADDYLDEVFPGWKKMDGRHVEDQEQWQTALAEGRVDEGIELLWDEAKEAESYKKFSLLKKLHTLAVILERKLLKEKVLLLAEKDLRKMAKSDENYFPYGLDFLFEALGKENEWGKVRELTDLVMKVDKDEDQFVSYHLLAILELDGAQALLTALGTLPDRGINDQSTYLSLLASKNKELGREVCKALRESGKAAEAEVLLQYLIAASGSYDPYYRDLLEHHREGMKAFLQQVMKYDPFEERPLIWLAHLALKQGKVPQARQWVEKAIALDPSDGDQGKESRMEAYKVLAAVYAAEGNEEKAKFYTDVTKAIREGELADDYLYVGLRNEAIRRYQKALGRFENAYCLQSRLAKTLVEQGRIAEAEQHFVKAFELMPVSFGPVESHCFGCEGAFDDKEARDIAQRVFERVIKTSPDNPRTYYLLGMVFENRGQKEEAFRYYLQAFELDPFYYNCAIKIDRYLWNHPEKLKDHREALQQILKITPYYHLPKRFANRMDLKQAWLDADRLAQSSQHPLTLTPLTLPFAQGEPEAAKTKYIRDQIKAIEGWKREQLLRGNRFLENLTNLQ